ncbi:MAG: hypothetical protein CVT98_09585 [Bacteroidetes bacterium HGW-Bacteroidetes-15]|nr:MAG: hypothetical protein CVT98_09585 [Bacteroidetes bacterium HGW-Bacteroidetes-15]
MFTKLKSKIGHSRLSKQLKSLQRNKMVYNLDSARRIGIVFIASSDLVFEQAIGFMNFLKEKNLDVKLIAYYPGKEIPQQFLLRKNINVFTKKDLNWYYKPLATFADEFIQSEFDILIDLSMQEAFPLKWISSLSRAKFKVGNLSYFGNPYDLVINIKPEEKLDYLISQIKHYLHLINNRFAQEKIVVD